MTFQEFETSLSEPAPPLRNPLLQALWWDARGDWSRAHEIAQEIESPHAAWVHGYLHRKQGDRDNARYWYQRAGKPDCRLPIEEEWRQIAQALTDAAEA